MAALKLTRNQFASFLKDAEQIKQFERLFATANSSVTVDVNTLDDGDYIYWDATAQTWIAKQPDALTRVNDTNVTLTLAGLSGTALFNPVSITAGWAGQLSVSRGGSGASSLTGYLKGNGVAAFTATATIPVADISGAVPDTRQVIAGAGLTGGGTLAADRTFDVGAGTGITVNANDVAISVNGVTNALFRQSVGLSVVGRSANTTGNVADITAGTDGQVLRRSGTSIGFGAVSLSTAAAVTGTLPVTNGGTGVTTSTGTTAVVLSNRPQFTSTIGVGTAASASGSGISFPATQSASTDANTLDDYEEGTWTPTVTATSGTITTLGAVGGYYTKIGRHVLATVDITITTNGTGAGEIVYTLPFTASSGGNWVGAGRETNATGNMLQTYVLASGTTGRIATYNNLYPAANGYRLIVSISYFV